MHTHTCPKCKTSWSHEPNWKTSEEFDQMHTCPNKDCGQVACTTKDDMEIANNLGLLAQTYVMLWALLY